MIKYPFVLFHIPKCGGTSVFEALQPHYPENQICPIRNEAICNHPLNLLQTYKLFCGHYSIEMIESFISKPYISAVLLRHPVKRILSSYYFCRSHTWNWINNNSELHKDNPYRDAKLYSLENFIKLHKEHLRDSIIKRICGRLYNFDLDSTSDESLIQSKELLSTMTIVGVLDQLEVFIKRIMNRLDIDWNGYVPHSLKIDNLSNEFDHCEDIIKEEPTAEVLELLNEITEKDLILYEYAKSLAI